MTRQAGNSWFLAYCYNQYGHICRNLGDYASAQHYYKESYHIRKGFADPEGQAIALNHLGTLALLRQQYEQAHTHFGRSLPIYERIGDRGGLLTAHEGLGIACTHSGRLLEARNHFLVALEICQDVEVASWWLSLIEAVGEFFAATGVIEQGVPLIRLTHQHSDSSTMTRIRAETWLQRHSTQDKRFDLEWSLETVKQRLEHELITCNIPEHPVELSNYPDTTQQGLIDPLTGRELVILRLLGEGMTNREIADHLVLAVGTIKSYNYNIFGKLGANNRGQAVKRARELKLL